MPRLPRTAALALAALLLGACRDLAEPHWRVEVGIVDFERSSMPAFSLPSTVPVGAPFEVTVTTVGSPDCTRAHDARVSVTGLVAEIVPLDAVRPPGTPCTRQLGAFPRTVRVRFDSPGAAVVRVRARDAQLREAVQEAAVLVEP